MNELEKALPETESATPETTAENAVVNSETKSDETANETIDNVAVEETDEVDNNNTVDYGRYYGMSKEQLIDCLEKIVEADSTDKHKEVNVIKQAYYAIRKNELETECAEFIAQGNEQQAFVSTPDPTEAQFKELLTAFKDKRTSFLAAEEQRRQENLEFKLKIIEKLKELVDDIDNINLHFPKFQQLQQDFKNITDIPAGAVNDTWKSYQLAVEQFYDRLKMNKELRDLDFKKNLEAKRSLIAEAKSLEQETDVVVAFKRLQALHEEWREIGPVAKELREEIWNEFKEASTIINKRHQDFFENRKAVEKENEDAKIKICEEIEAINLDEIKTFSGWDETTKAIINMQERWKAIGFASKKVNNQIFARFRKSCDDFFARKAEFYKKTKDDFAANLEKKTALCEKAEALKDCEDIKKATEQIVALQAEWKKIGSVARKHSDAIWQRFITACNYFFDAKKKQAAALRQEENANLTAKREVIASIKAIPADTAHDEAVKTVRELQSKWSSIGHVPYKMKDKLYDEYKEVLKVAYDTFDIKEIKAKMNNFEGQIENISGDENKLYRERERLMRAYEQKRNELKTFENNLGFFNIKSSAGNSMLKEMERRTQRIKDDMALIEKKIELIDSKIN